MNTKKRFVRLFSEVVDGVSDTNPKKDFVYYDTLDQDFEEEKKSLIMEKRDDEEDFDEDDIDDEMVWDRIRMNIQDDYENFMFDARTFDEEHDGLGYVAESCSIGHLHRGDCTYQYKGYLEDLLNEVFDKPDVMEWKVAFEGGDLRITGLHHDGTTIDIIRQVGKDKESKRLIEKFFEEEDDLSAEEEDELLGDIFYKGTSVLV